MLKNNQFIFTIKVWKFCWNYRWHKHLDLDYFKQKYTVTKQRTISCKVISKFKRMMMKSINRFQKILNKLRFNKTQKKFFQLSSSHLMKKKIHQTYLDNHLIKNFKRIMICRIQIVIKSKIQWKKRISPTRIWWT